MEKVGTFEAKTHFASLLDRVARGEEIVIPRHGTPVAKLTPVGGSSRERRRKAIDQLKEFCKGQALGDLTLRELRDQGRR